jgi:hypothetical protein
MKRVWNQALPFRALFLAVQFYSLLHVLKTIFHFSLSDYSSYAFPISALYAVCRSHIILRDLIIGDLWGRVELENPLQCSFHHLLIFECCHLHSVILHTQTAFLTYYISTTSIKKHIDIHSYFLLHL